MKKRSTFYIGSAALLFVTITPGICLAQSSPPPQNKPSVSNAANGITVILPGSAANYLFPKGTQFWTPTRAEIATMESALPMLAAKTPVPHQPAGSSPLSIANYYRQYIGIIQDGKKRVYVNAFRATFLSEFPYWRQRPIFVDDGGTGFYHVTYDVKTHRFGAVQFNGYA